MDQRLHVFITVAESKNFSRAAEKLHMTQPAVSQYIRLLEENLEVRLLERTNQYVKLNKAGEIVYHHAKEIMGLYARMQHLVDDLTNKANGPLAIGASYTFGEYVLPHIIATMKKHYPRIQPSIKIGNTTTIADDVRHHQLDIGIIEGHFDKEERLQTEGFAQDEMVLVAGTAHPLSNREEKHPLTNLAPATWILRETGSGTREASELLFQQYHFTPKETIHFGSTQSIKAAVEEGLGISLLSKWAIQKEVKNGELVVLDVKELPFKRNFSIITSSPFQTKALQVFIHLLHQKELTVLTDKKDE